LPTGAFERVIDLFKTVEGDYVGSMYFGLLFTLLPDSRHFLCHKTVYTAGTPPHIIIPGDRASLNNARLSLAWVITDTCAGRTSTWKDFTFFDEHGGTVGSGGGAIIYFSNDNLDREQMGFGGPEGGYVEFNSPIYARGFLSYSPLICAIL